MRILATLLLGAGVFCLTVKLPHYGFALGVLAIAATLLSKN